MQRAVILPLLSSLQLSDGCLRLKKWQKGVVELLQPVKDCHWFGAAGGCWGYGWNYKWSLSIPLLLLIMNHFQIAGIMMVEKDCVSKIMTQFPVGFLPPAIKQQKRVQKSDRKSQRQKTQDLRLTLKNIWMWADSQILLHISPTSVILHGGSKRALLMSSSLVNRIKSAHDDLADVGSIRWLKTVSGCRYLICTSLWYKKNGWKEDYNEGDNAIVRANIWDCKPLYLFGQIDVLWPLKWHRNVLAHIYSYIIFYILHIKYQCENHKLITG